MFISKIKAYLGNLENLETYENEEADFVVETDFLTWRIKKRKRRPDQSTSSKSSEFFDECNKY